MTSLRAYWLGEATRLPLAARRFAVAAGAGVSLVAVPVVPAHSQTAAVSAPALTDAADEIVVTAQKRVQSASSVGISLAVIGGDNLRERTLLDVTKLANMVPGLVAPENAGPGSPPLIFLRGVGLNDFNTNNTGPIAIYQDEVYKGSSTGGSFLPYDQERIEVLKGPQGTLFGRNATGGAIRFISRKPSDKLEFSGIASYASFNTARLELVANLPINDRLQLRLSGITTTSDGWVRNRLDPDQNQRGYGLGSWRAQLAFDATDNLDILLTGQGDYSHSTGIGQQPRGTRSPTDSSMVCADADIIARKCANFLGYVREPGRYAVATDGPTFTNRDAYTVSGVINWHLGDFTLTSVSSYETVDFLRNDDADGSPDPLVQVTIGQKSETFTQEGRLAYDVDRFKGTIGVFYLDETIDQDQSADIFRAFRPAIEAVDPMLYPGGFDPSGSAIGVPAFLGRFVNRQTTQAISVFGQGQYDLTDTLDIIGGLRYSSEKRRFLTTATFVEPTFIAPFYSLPLKVDNDNLSFKVGVEWKPAPDRLLYATISSGYKSGGFNGGFVFDPRAAVPYAPETLIAYEIGAKNYFRDAKLRLNVAAFYYDYSDIQVFTFSNVGNVALTVLTNAADATIWGLEGDASWQPLDGLTLSGSIAYLNSKFNRFDAAFGNGDFSGNRTALTPEFSAAGHADYEQDIGSRLSGRIGGGFSYKSRVFSDPSNTAPLSQPGYAIFDASISLGDKDDRWRVSVFAENLTDEYYFPYTLSLAAFGLYQYFPGEPRTVGVRLAAKY